MQAANVPTLAISIPQIQAQSIEVKHVEAEARKTPPAYFSICSCACDPSPAGRSVSPDDLYTPLRSATRLFLGGFSCLHFLFAICRLERDASKVDRLSAQTCRELLRMHMADARHGLTRNAVERVAIRERVKRPWKWASSWCSAYADALGFLLPNVEAAWGKYLVLQKTHQLPDVYIQMRDQLTGLIVCLTSDHHDTISIRPVVNSTPFVCFPQNKRRLLHMLVVAAGLEVWKCRASDIGLEGMTTARELNYTPSVLYLTDCVQEDPFCVTTASCMFLTEQHPKTCRVLQVHDAYTQSACARADDVSTTSARDHLLSNLYAANEAEQVTKDGCVGCRTRGGDTKQQQQQQQQQQQPRERSNLRLGIRPIFREAEDDLFGQVASGGDISSQTF
jgi:hypothetical protein